MRIAPRLRHRTRRLRSWDVHDSHDAVGGGQHSTLHVDRFAGVGSLVHRSKMMPVGALRFLLSNSATLTQRPTSTIS